MRVSTVFNETRKSLPPPTPAPYRQAFLRNAAAKATVSLNEWWRIHTNINTCTVCVNTMWNISIRITNLTPFSDASKSHVFEFVNLPSVGRSRRLCRAFSVPQNAKLSHVLTAF